LDVGPELVKSGLTLGVSLATLALGWGVGARITAGWDQKKKRRELTMTATDAFYRSYGEFFAIWKEWSASRIALAGSGDVDKATRSQLLSRAAVAEGAVEALLLKLAMERQLTPADVEILGCFRQAYQVMRESIRDNRPIGFGNDAWHSSEAPGYAVFKGLATRLAQIVAREHGIPDEVAAQQAFHAITSNRFESDWVRIGQQFLNSATSPANPRGSR